MNFISFWVVCFTCTCLFALMNPFVGDLWFNETYKLPVQIIVIMVVNFFIAVMVYPVESFRTANGLFVQGWARPAIMAVMNIVLDFYLGKSWGIVGILIATTIARLSTQVWFDAYLIYKHVFKKSVKRYYLEYLYYAAITAACCAVAYLMGNSLSVGNVYVNFLIKMVVAVLIPNLAVIILFRKTDGFTYLLNMMKRVFHKLVKHKKRV